MPHRSNQMLYWMFLLAIGFPAVITLFTMVVCFFERRHVWPLERVSHPVTEDLADRGVVGVPGSAGAVPVSPYQPPVAPENRGLPITDAGRVAGEALTAAGYEYLAEFRDSRGGIYQVRTDAMWSPDRAVLAMVLGGHLMRIPLNAVELISLVRRPPALNEPDNKDWFLLISTSDEKSYEADFSGRVETMIFQNASMEDLHHYHYQRLATAEPVAMDISPLGELWGRGGGAAGGSGDPLANLKAIHQACIEVAVNRGLFQWIGPDVAKPTLRGGLATALRNHRVMWGRRWYPHRFRLRRQMKHFESRHGRVDLEPFGTT